jgi:hypothetical protein
VDVDGHGIRDVFGDDEIPANASCALDIADRKRATLEEVGNALGLSTAYTRELEYMAARSVLLISELARVEPPHWLA